MGLLRRKRAAPTTTLDLGAVTVDWPGHLAAVTQLAQLQSASTDLPSRAEPSRPLLLRLVELPVAQQASLVLHQHLLQSALWRRDVAAALPRTPFRTFDEPWGTGVLTLTVPLVMHDGDALLDAALAGRSEVLADRLRALTTTELDDLLAPAAVVQALAALAEDPQTALVGLGAPPVTTLGAALLDRELWPGAPDGWGGVPGLVDVDHVPVSLDAEHPSQAKVAEKVSSGVRRSFSLSSTVLGQLVGPRIGANLLGGNLFTGALSGILGTWTEALGVWCLHGVQPEPTAPDAPALSGPLPVPLTPDPRLQVLVRLDACLRGRLPRADEPVGADGTLRAGLEGSGSDWVVELPLPHGETGPLDGLVTAHLRLLADALLGLPGLSSQARSVLTDVAGLAGPAGGLVVTGPVEAAAALAREWLAEGLAKP